MGPFVYRPDIASTDGVRLLYFAGRPDLRAEIKAFLFNYVSFKFLSRILQNLHIVYIFSDSGVDPSFAYSLLFGYIRM